jgi:hypothetical protein
MHVIHGASAPSAQGKTFTGDVRLTRLLGAAEPGGITVSSVRFEDGARTNWHEHPGEQVLYVVEGEARRHHPPASQPAPLARRRRGRLDDASEHHDSRPAHLVRGSRRLASRARDRGRGMP